MPSELAEVDRHLDTAAELQRRGEPRAAAGELACARRLLLRLAKDATIPAVKQQRLKQAERLAMLEKHWRQNDPDPLEKPVQEASCPVHRARFQPETVDRTLTFDAVAGLEDAKREIRLRMILPFAHQEMARAFKVETGGGILLYGPPGTGKTLLARAAAAELDAAFFSVKASDIMTKWVGEAEKSVEALFADAHAWERAVVFIDEIEALVPARGSNSSTVMARVVPQFLAEMQGFRQHRNSLLLMGASNIPWAIDPAMLRPGRFDALIYVGLPTAEARKVQFARLLNGRPLAADVDLEHLGNLTDGYSGADIFGIVEAAAREGFAESLHGELRPLSQGMLERLAASTRPSVTASQLSRYRRFGGEGYEQRG